MKILFDHGTPRSIARSLPGHEVTRAAELGWHEIGNGELIRRAEEAGFDVFLSTDRIYAINRIWGSGRLRL